MRKIILFLLLLPVMAFGQDRFTENAANTIDIFLRDSTTGNGKTGVTVTGITCDLAKHQGTLAATKTTFTCAASGSSNDCVEIAHGLYNVELSAGNLDTRGSAKLVCQCSGAFDSKNNIEVVSAASFAVNVDGDISDNATVADAVLDELMAGHTTTGSLGALLNTNLDYQLSTLAATVAAVPTSLLDLTDGIETNYTLRQSMRIILSTQAGKLSGVNSNAPVFRDVNDTKNRVTSTTDATGRTAVTLDPN